MRKENDVSTFGETPNQERPRFIVVEGPIGVGKTSLAKKLAQSFKSELLLEAAHENPFLERFYKNPKQGALPAQLFFLMQRAQQVSELNQSDLFEPVRVADFLVEKDRLFAELTLDTQEFALYEQMYQHLTLDALKPDLVIYLQAPVDVLKSHIQRRGVDMEQRIERDYLENLSESYSRFFFDYKESPLLVVNAATLNFVDNASHYEQLLERIVKMDKGRHYFNPVFSAA